MRLTIFFTSVLLLHSCTQPSNGIQILADNGYTDIKIGPYATDSQSVCKKEDLFRFNFQAKSINGANVEGIVCSDRAVAIFPSLAENIILVPTPHK
jgi:hypothetical protein